MDGSGVRAGLGHRFQVQLEVAAMGAYGMFVRLFAKHDLIDQACALRVSGWQPGQLRACQVLLQAFSQAHEIPNSKYMLFHKKL